MARPLTGDIIVSAGGDRALVQYWLIGEEETAKLRMCKATGD